jgi:ubiquinone/menaquinone biosynthesis C-methylase UbiE
MSFPIHSSAKPSHYNKEAEHYDIFNEENSRLINHALEKILKKYKVKSVLDLTCGTGSQLFWLAKRGFKVLGLDINSKMLAMARNKAKTEKLDVKFCKGDMRYTEVGKFDAVITIFNAIGHLTKLDFEIAMQNIYKNLKEGGLYVFDINNLSYLLKDNHILDLTIDWQKRIGNTKIRDIQYSTIDEAGILASYTISYVQKNSCKPKISRSEQTLQIYAAKQLKEMLKRNGFKVLHQYSIDGTKFIESKTERILTVAQKK